MRPKKYLLTKLKKSQKKVEKREKRWFFKLFFYMKTYLINKIVIKIQKIARTESIDDLSSIIKDIVLYGLIGYTIYHLIFNHNNTLLIILGCGSLYYIYRDWLDFTITTMVKIRGKK